LTVDPAVLAMISLLPSPVLNSSMIFARLVDVSASRRSFRASTLYSSLLDVTHFLPNNVRLYFLDRPLLEVVAVTVWAYPMNRREQRNPTQLRPARRAEVINEATSFLL